MTEKSLHAALRLMASNFVEDNRDEILDQALQDRLDYYYEMDLAQQIYLAKDFLEETFNDC